MKRIISFVLAVLILATTFAGMDFSAYAQDGITYSWDEDEGVLTFFGTGALGNYTHTNRPDWDSYSDYANEIVIEDGITEIGDYCFYQTNARKITVAGSVYRIGNRAFYRAGLGNDLDIQLCEGVKLIESNAFSGVYFAEGFRLPDSIERIDEYAFADAQMYDFYVPDSLSFTPLIFDDSYVMKVSVSENNTRYYVEDDVLYSKDGSTLVYYPSGKCDESEWAITRFTVPAGVTAIGEGAFSDCIDLEIVDLNKASTVKSYAFDNAMSLNIVIAQANVVNIASDAKFPKGSSLIFITSAGTAAESYAIENNNTISYDGKCTVTLDANGGAFEDGSTTKEYVVVFDHEYGDMPEPSKEGMDFVGWYDGTVEYTSDTVCLNPINFTLTAKYGLQSVMIDIDPGADDVIWESECTGIKTYYGKNYSTVLRNMVNTYEPTKTGYHIDHYELVTVDEEGAQIYQVIDGNTTVENMERHTVKIVWTPNTYKIHYLRSTTSSTSFTEQTVTYDEPFTVLDVTPITKLGWQFNKKWEDPDGNIYTAGDIINHNYAERSNSAVSFKPVYDHYDELPLNTPTEVQVTERGGKVYFSFTPEVSGTYAFYSEGNYKPIGALYDSDMNELATDVRSGVDNNFKIVYNMTAGETYNLAAYHDDYFTVNQVFTVVLKKTVGVTVTFDPLDGALSDESSTRVYSYGLPYGGFPTCEREGYNFDYWSKDVNDLTPLTTDSKVDELNDYTLYAHYVPINYYVYLTVKFNKINKRKIITVKYDEEFTLPTAEELGVSVDGYKFAGWATAKNTSVIAYTDGATVKNLLSTPSGAIELYAVYTSVSHDINLFSNGATVTTVNYTDGDLIYLPTAQELGLTRAGWKFLGWSKSPTRLNVDIEDGGLLTEDGINWDNPTLTAVWQQLSYHVEIYYNDEKVNEGEFSCAEYHTLPDSFKTLTGYDDEHHKLIGYKLDGSDKEPYDFGAGGQFKDIAQPGETARLYVVTMPVGTYIVNYINVRKNGNTYQTMYGYACEEDAVLKDYRKALGNTVDGIFLGWSTSRLSYEVEYNNKEVIPAGTFENGTEITLYAVWDKITHNISYDMEEGATMPAGEIMTEFNEGQFVWYSMLPRPELDDYVFDGWYLDKYYTEIFLDSDHFGTYMDFDEDITLYAHFSKEMVSFTLDPKGGTVNGESTAVIERWVAEEMGKLPEAVKSGYVFDGWYVGNDKVEENSWAEAVYMHGSTLYAKWLPASYMIFLDANGGECDTVALGVQKDANISSLPTPTRYGYTFEGWYYTDPDGNEKQIKNGAKFTYTENITLTAHWSKNYVTVRFDSNGGSYVSNRTYAVGEQLGTLPVTERSGYIFDGWYTNRNGGTVVKPIVVLEDQPSYTFYAHWSAKDYTIYLNPDGGTCDVTSIDVKADQTSIEFPVPQRENYAFIGWYFGDELFTEEELFDSDGYILDIDITLTAKWEKLITKTGWIKEDGKWYYYDDNGEILTGWLLDNNKWYYLGDDGVMTTGWQKVGGYWYYMNSGGAMQTGWIKLSGKWYYLNSSGRMLTGWQKIGGYWYYMNSSGVMQTGWIKLSGKWYYLESSGKMRTADLTYKGKVYKFNSSGVCLNP